MTVYNGNTTLRFDCRYIYTATSDLPGELTGTTAQSVKMKSVTYCTTRCGGRHAAGRLCCCWTPGRWCWRGRTLVSVRGWLALSSRTARPHPHPRSSPGRRPPRGTPAVCHHRPLSRCDWTVTCCPSTRWPLAADDLQEIIGRCTDCL